MVSENQKQSKEIASISVTGHSELSTAKGIHIGSPKTDVVKVYKDSFNKEESQDAFIVGSMYDGLIFEFKKGKVSKIFLGSAAE